MQLSLFDTVFEKGISSINSSDDTKKLSKWQLFEWFESKEGELFSLEYKDRNMEASLPLKLGKMSFSLFSHSTNEPVLRSFDNEKERVLTLSGRMESCVIKNDNLEFYFEHTSYRENKRMIESGIKSKVQWKVKNNYITPLKQKKKLDIDDKLNQKEIIQQLIGMPISIKVRFHNDLFSEFISEPFVCSSLKIEKDTIMIASPNDTTFKINGFKKMRVSSEYLLFDVSTQESGYSQSFYILF